MCMSDCVDGTASTCRSIRRHHHRVISSTPTLRNRPSTTRSRYAPSASNSNHLHPVVASSSTSSSHVACSSSTVSATGRFIAAAATAATHSNRNVDSTIASCSSARTAPASSADGRLVGIQDNHAASDDDDECNDDDEKRRRRRFTIQTRLTSPWRQRVQPNGDGQGMPKEASADIGRRSSIRHSRKIHANLRYLKFEANFKMYIAHLKANTRVGKYYSASLC